MMRVINVKTSTDIRLLSAGMYGEDSINDLFLQVILDDIFSKIELRDEGLNNFCSDFNQKN